jgi:L,D-peptidoglycan transpeptidase YkuD (ErfK/YbiS/YcfS/YnhG family)
MKISVKRSTILCNLILVPMCFLGPCASHGAKGDQRTPSPIPSESEQLIIVIPESWDDLKAILFLMSKQQDSWSKVRQAPAVLGRNGIAWGLGLHANPKGERTKVEGDGRGPAGIFEIGRCMGYAKEPSYSHAWPYLSLSKNHIGVDDASSPYYNQVIDRTKVSTDAAANITSFETMRRRDDLYKWLFEIQHNELNIPGAGSLIFFHLWRGPDKGTGGCTAVSEETMNTVLGWIDPEKRPVLVQLPRSTYERLQSRWQLPSLQFGG